MGYRTFYGYKIVSQAVQSRVTALCLLVFSVLKMESVPFEMLVNFCHTTQHHMQKTVLCIVMRTSNVNQTSACINILNINNCEFYICKALLKLIIQSSYLQ
jgi:hypothetical protein